jgi:hypothetical protein
VLEQEDQRRLDPPSDVGRRAQVALDDPAVAPTRRSAMIER